MITLKPSTDLYFTQEKITTLHDIIWDHRVRTGPNHASVSCLFFSGECQIHFNNSYDKMCTLSVWCTSKSITTLKKNLNKVIDIITTSCQNEFHSHFIKNLNEYMHLKNYYKNGCQVWHVWFLISHSPYMELKKQQKQTLSFTNNATIIYMRGSAWTAITWHFY